MSLPAIEIFAIGTELILGRVQDTNFHWLTQRLTELGGNLRRVTMLTDDEPDLLAALGEALTRGTEVIITMGGLGPTADDRTVATVAKLLGRGTYQHEPTVRQYMQRRELTDRSQVTPGLLKMATVPDNAEVFNNPEGWAPCIHLTTDRSHIFILPGPPRELTSLFPLAVAPFLRELFTGFSATRRVYVEAFESEIAPIFEELMEQYPRTYMKAMIAKKMENPEQGLPVDLVATGDDEAAARATMEALLDEFQQRLWTLRKTLLDAPTL